MSLRFRGNDAAIFERLYLDRRNVTSAGSGIQYLHMAPLAVIAIGGNAIIKDDKHPNVPDEYAAVGETCQHIVKLIRDGWEVAIVHGNGPQVGFNLRRSELAAQELFEIPLDVCVTFTQGSIGYYFQQNLFNLFQREGIQKPVLTVVTQVEVDANDPAFKQPSKPIGSFLSHAQALSYQAQGWPIMEDSGRGWRRVVASPYPLRILEENSIGQLLRGGTVVIAVGGGGVPVLRGANGDLKGTFAIIDKDFASALLASHLAADWLVITTSVPKVALNFGKPNQVWLDELTLAQAKQYLAEGQFGKGSMAPKVQAVIDYLERGGQHAVITDIAHLSLAMSQQAGTHFTKH